jgi:glycosyltransferase involved in cell wall biosynthesis
VLRVGFFFQGGEGWLGGVNYLWNLLYAITRHEGARIQPVVVADPSAPMHGIEDLDVEVVRASIRPATPRDQMQRTIERRLVGRDVPFERFCTRERIEVISHSGTYGWRFDRPTLPWIADLQHRRLPQYFGSAEIARRIYIDASQLFEGTRTIVSSVAARDDVRRYYPLIARHIEVLHFVSQPRVDRKALPSAAVLRARYVVPERYFFVPNQFWRHKNHVVVIDALEALARRGIHPVVVLTGKGDDYRAPRYYGELMRRVDAAGLEGQFRHLGLVPHVDLIALMRDAVAVVNPSYFEGWSTTVEEARSMGKAMILSDIAVHREQDPPAASYFPPDDPVSLARALEQRWSGRDHDDETTREAAADASLPERTAAFAARYRMILEAAAS